MNTGDKIVVIIWIVILLSLWFIHDVRINQRPTRAETIAICDSIIKANSNTIFDKKNAGRLESCLYTIIEVQRGEAYPHELTPHLHWLVDRNEQRIEEAREKFKE